MASSDIELRNEVRDFTGYDEITLEIDRLKTCVARAKRRITSRKQSLGRPTDVEWYDPDSPQLEEALYWHTVIYAKMATGDLDAPDIKVGNKSHEPLSREDTELYTYAEQALNSVNFSSHYGVGEITRDSRVYGDEG